MKSLNFLSTLLFFKKLNVKNPNEVYRRLNREKNTLVNGSNIYIIEILGNFGHTILQEIITLRNEILLVFRRSNLLKIYIANVCILCIYKLFLVHIKHVTLCVI